MIEEALLAISHETDFFEQVNTSGLDISQIDDKPGLNLEKVTNNRLYTVRLERRADARVYNVLVVNNFPIKRAPNSEVLGADDYFLAGRVIAGNFEQAAKLYLASLRELNGQAA